jgi:Putative metallopeptidase
MSSLQWKAMCSVGTVVGVALMFANLAIAQPDKTIILKGSEPARVSGPAQSQTSVMQSGEPNQVKIAYVAPENPGLHEVFALLKERHALEKVQEILSPFRLTEELTITTDQCGMVNSFYRRAASGPMVTICYEYLQHILESLPKENSPAGVTPGDAAVGQFLWITFHEVGHAIFDIFKVPIFGHPEDAADNFAAYVMLHFGKGQALRLIGGAAWAWRAYLGDYKRNPTVSKRLANFASNHGLPEERFYNLLCLAFGADPVQFADLNNYLPPTRSQSCSLDYNTLVYAFEKEIRPHLDVEIARRVLDANWLPAPDWKPIGQK